MNQNYNPQTKSKTKNEWDGFIYETEIYGLAEPLYRYKVEDMQRFLTALTRGGNPKILYIEYEYSDEDESDIVIVDPEFKAFLQEKGKISPTGKVDNIKEDDVKEFLKLKGALSLYNVYIEDNEDVATIVAYI
jgi:hypothetical protein